MKKSNPIIEAQILRCLFYLLLFIGILRDSIRTGATQLRWSNDIGDVTQADPKNPHLRGPGGLSARD